MFTLKSISPVTLLIASLVAMAPQVLLADVSSHPFNALPLRSGACHMAVLDTTDGLRFESNGLEVSKHTALRYGTPYFDLWKNGIGPDNSSIFALVQPYIDSDNRLMAQIHVEREHDVNGTHEIRAVEITAGQVSPDQVLFDIHSKKTIDGITIDTRSNVFGTYANGKLSMDENTEELQVNLTCQLQ